jgi:hypothetical protein
MSSLQTGAGLLQYSLLLRSIHCLKWSSARRANINAYDGANDKKSNLHSNPCSAHAESLADKETNIGPDKGANQLQANPQAHISPDLRIKLKSVYCLCSEFEIL